MQKKVASFLTVGSSALVFLLLLLPHDIILIQADETNGITDSIILPNPPLAPNPFADSEVLDLYLAQETVTLAGSLIYQVANETHARDLLPEEYTFHDYTDTGSTEVMIISSDHDETKLGKIMVVFRGTDDTADGDWLTNINIPQVAYGPPNKILHGTTVVEKLDFSTLSIKNTTISIKVHKGFNGVFSDNLYEHVLSVLNTEALLLRTDNTTSELYYNNTVHFMGHSLGGANAQVMGTYYAHFHPEIKIYITSLGAPRQGNLGFKVLTESLPNLVVWRMVNCRDVVPRVPNVNYYHAGHLIFNRCTDESLPNGERVEAFYRQDGDEAQGFADVSIAQWIVSPSAGIELVNDHLGFRYTEWIESAVSSMGDKNWTSTFVLETDSSRRLSMHSGLHKKTDNHATLPEPLSYDDAVKKLYGQGTFQRLRGSK